MWNNFIFLAIILTILLVATIVAADGERERRPRYPNRRPSRPQEKEDHFDEEDLDTPLSERPSRFTKDGYLINYSEIKFIIERTCSWERSIEKNSTDLHCSTRSCFCSNICQPWAPCDCMCPPPCPPTTTTTTTTKPEIICTNGAPSWTYPECCFNGGHGEFCCRNGAQNLHCCTNGANNPWCSLWVYKLENSNLINKYFINIIFNLIRSPTEAPVQGTTPPSR